LKRQGVIDRVGNEKTAIGRLKQRLVSWIGAVVEMAYKPIEVDRENLTLMGVPFPSLDTPISATDAIASNMFEGI
jgi:hypothetical protein